jgi:hypothetical protein
VTRLVRGVALATLVLLAGACGQTTVLTGPSTTYLGETTTIPTGTVDELLARLQTTAYSLSIAIVDGDAKERIAEIHNLWTAISVQLPRTDFVDETQHQIDLMQAAVDRKHPADADKAALRLSELIAARPK